MPLFKNIIIVYHPGTGGNHLANMLCTHPDTNNYLLSDKVLDCYNNATGKVHINQLYSNLDLTSIDFILPKLSDTKINVLWCHAFQYRSLKHILSDLTNKCIIVVGVDLKSTLCTRANKATPGFKLTYDSALMYSEDMISTMSGLDKDRIFTFSGKLLEEESASGIVQFFKVYLDLELPQVVYDMHKIWFDKNIKDLL